MADYTLSYTVNEIEEKLAKVDTLTNTILSKVYPVGAIFLSTVNTNPATYLGFGTWSIWGSGRVPVGVNTSDSNFNTVEKTGGASTHTLTLAQIPKHSHSVSGTAASAGGHTHRSAYKRVDAYGSGSMDAVHWTNYKDGEVTTSSNGAHTHSVSGTAASQGGSGAHNNLQPYITCYMWKRTT